jgi:hypothetical protein
MLQTVTGERSGTFLYVAPRTDVIWQLYRKLQLRFRHSSRFQGSES